jgi:glycosyltransferase involved in cell wall biosynthesis
MADDVGTVAIVHFTEAMATGVLGVVRELANDSAARGIPTTVVHGRRPQTPADLVDRFHPDVRLVEAVGFGSRSLRGAVATARAAVVLRAELTRQGGGILHVHSTFAGVVGRLVAPRHGWKMFYSPHGYAFLNPGLPRAVRLAARATERLLGRRAFTLTASDTEAGVARSQLGLRDVATVQNGIAAGPPPTRPPAAESTARVVFVGRAVPERRPLLYAAIATRFSDRAAVSFQWVGDGPFRPELERAGVQVTGWVSPSEVAARLADADVVMHLATFEGLPLALLEAMGAGRPIVASDHPVLREVGEGIFEFIQDVDDGVIVLESLLADPDLREQLGKAASDRVRERYSIEAMTRAAYRAYGLGDAA